MSDILATIGADLGNVFLSQNKIPITLSSTGQAISVKQPVQASQIPSPAMSLTSSSSGIAGPVGSPALSTAPVAAGVKAIGRWALAFVAFLFVIMFLTPKEAGGLSLIVVLGALMFNAESAKSAGRPTVVQTVLGG